MKLELNIKKRQVYLLSFLIVTTFGILFVQGQGISNFGHSSNQVEIVIEGTTKTLQEAYDAGDFNPELNLGQECITKRTSVLSKDSVGWCNSDYPNLVHCSLADDQAPNSGPTVLSSAGSSSGTCQSDGLCKADNIRSSLAKDSFYLELVVKDNGITNGCWQYDSGHSRQDYHLDLVCCK